MRCPTQWLLTTCIILAANASTRPCPIRSTQAMAGVIAQRYRALGESDGLLGCAVGSETAGERGALTQTFEGGSIVFSPSLGTAATVAAYVDGTQIAVEWGPTEPFVYDFFYVRWDVNGQNQQQQDVAGRNGGRFLIRESEPGSYRVTVEGCLVSRPGLSPRCSQGWSNEAVVSVRRPVPQGLSSGIMARRAPTGSPAVGPTNAVPRNSGAPAPSNTAPYSNPARPGSQYARPSETPMQPYARPGSSAPGNAPNEQAPGQSRPNYSEPGSSGPSYTSNTPSQGYSRPGAAVPGNASNAPSQGYARPAENGGGEVPQNQARPDYSTANAASANTGFANSIPPRPTPNPNQKFHVPEARNCPNSMPTGIYLQEYMRLGGPNGPMGCPVQQSGPTEVFENGSIAMNGSVWPNGVIAAFQDGFGITVDWAVSFGDPHPGYNYDKFVVRWASVADPNNSSQLDIPAKLDQPEHGDTHMRSEGTYTIPWSGAATAVNVAVEGCDNPTGNLLKPDPLNTRCLQGWMPMLRVGFNPNLSSLPPDDVAFVFFANTGVHPATSVADSKDQLRARAAAAILQAACSRLSYVGYGNEEGYRNALFAKMLYADYFDSDRCPGRNVNNRDEVNDSLRAQTKGSDENAGSTFDGISVPKWLGDVCGPNNAECPPYRKGEYDVLLSGYSALLSRYGSALAPDVYHHVLYDLLTKKGPLNPSDLQINIMGVLGSETENHVLQIVTAQYLTNQLLFQDTRDSQYNNAANGMNAFMADFLHGLLTRDFLEYNARPYQDYAIPAIQNLYSFAMDVNDAPPGAASSHSVKVAAQMVLDYISAKVAVSSDDGRRSAPFRRKAKYDVISPDHPNAHDLLGGDADAQGPRMMYLAGVGLDQPSVMLGSTAYAYQMVHAAFSSYRVPDLILDEMLNRTQRRTFQSFHHSADEIYWRSTSYMLSAGGHPAETLYPYHADPGTVAAIASAVTGVSGAGVVLAGVAGGVGALIAATIQVGDDDARGVAVPTTLIPAGPVRSRDDLLRFEGAAQQNSTNMCVAPYFACGQSLQIPPSYLARRNCVVQRQGAVPGSTWTFLDFSEGCSTMPPYGFLVAIWTLNGDGFFEVYDKPGAFGASQQMGQSERLRPQPYGVSDQMNQSERLPPGASNQMSQSEPARPGAVTANQTSAENLTFAQFVTSVLGRNGSKNFTTNGDNAGANSYVTTAGTQVPFRIGPESWILTQRKSNLVTGSFMNSDIPGRITITNDRLGEALILDDSTSYAPARTLRTGLPTTQFNKNDAYTR